MAACNCSYDVLQSSSHYLLIGQPWVMLFRKPFHYLVHREVEDIASINLIHGEKYTQDVQFK